MHFYYPAVLVLSSGFHHNSSGNQSITLPYYLCVNRLMKEWTKICEKNFWWFVLSVLINLTVHRNSKLRYWYQSRKELLVISLAWHTLNNVKLTWSYDCVLQLKKSSFKKTLLLRLIRNVQGTKYTIIMKFEAFYWYKNELYHSRLLLLLSAMSKASCCRIIHNVTLHLLFHFCANLALKRNKLLSTQSWG